MNAKPSQTVNLLGIAGSLRQGSFNQLLLEAGAGLAPSDAELTVYRDLSDVPPFNQDLEDVAPAGVTRLRGALRKADGLLIATPEYNQSVPGVLKNVIDWLSRSEPEEGIAGKPVAVIGATTGPWGTRLAQTHLRQILVSCHALLLPSPVLYVKDAAGLFDGSGSLTAEETQDGLRSVLNALVAWVRLVSPPPQVEALLRVG